MSTNGNGRSPVHDEKYALNIEDLNVYYTNFRAVKHSSLDIEKQKITAFIGPSGCGKSTVLRALNRMNDLIPGVSGGG